MKHLTAAQIDTLKAQLNARTRLMATAVREALAASEHQHYRDLAGTVSDTADEALADALVDLETALIDRQFIELRDLDGARARLQAGNYGICVDCGDVVSYQRLAAYPTAKRCLRCQQQRERNYAHEPRSTL